MLSTDVASLPLMNAAAVALKQLASVGLEWASVSLDEAVVERTAEHESKGSA